MKRLLEERDSAFATLSDLVASAEAHQPNPFAKRLVQARVARALEGGPRRKASRFVLVGAVLSLVAASAAAAGYSWLAAPAPAPAPVGPALVVTPPELPKAHVAPAAAAAPAAEMDTKPLEKPLEKHAEKARPGEDPSQVAEAVRALRKQGDPVRAQALLDQYLRESPRGALAEDALALAIEAAVARKDPRAADYARRYLSRYPNGRFRNLAEHALAR